MHPGELAGRVVLGLLGAGAELIASLAAERDRSPPDTGWPAARAFLARHATSVREDAGALHARLGPSRAHAHVDLTRDAARIACAWDGGSACFTRRSLRASPPSRLLAPLHRLEGATEASSNGRTLVVLGSHALASRLDEATRLVAEITSVGRRMRAALDAHPDRPARREWDVAVTMTGAHAVLRRPVPLDGVWTFAIDRRGELRVSSAARPPEAMITALGAGPVRIRIAAGTATVRWPVVPSAAALARVERALASASVTSPYR